MRDFQLVSKIYPLQIKERTPKLVKARTTSGEQAIAGIMSIDLYAMIWTLAALETLLGGQETR